MIAIGSDHAAFEFKEEMKQFLDKKGVSYKDFGTHSEGSVDYPTYGEVVAKAVASGEFKRGIIFCGTGIGISIAANKVRGIRAVVCSEPYSAKLSRQHNDTNILSLGARVVGTELAKMIIEVWLETPFEGGRHGERVQMISDIEAEADR